MTDDHAYMTGLWNVPSYSLPSEPLNGSGQLPTDPHDLSTASSQNSPPLLPTNSAHWMDEHSRLHFLPVAGLSGFLHTQPVEHPPVTNSVSLGQPHLHSALSSTPQTYNPYLASGSGSIWNVYHQQNLANDTTVPSHVNSLHGNGHMLGQPFTNFRKRSADEVAAIDPSAFSKKRRRKDPNQVPPPGHLPLSDWPLSQPPAQHTIHPAESQLPSTLNPSELTNELPQPVSKRKSSAPITPSELPVYAAPRKPRTNVRPYSVTTDVPEELAELPVEQLFEEVVEEVPQAIKSEPTSAELAFHDALPPAAPLPGQETMSNPVGSQMGTTTAQRFKCRICTHTFPKKHTVIAHIKTHLGRKPFQCRIEGCDMAFVREHDRKRHEITHTGIRPYTCECGKPFSRPDALRRHTQYGRCAARPDEFKGNTKPNKKNDMGTSDGAEVEPSDGSLTHRPSHALEDSPFLSEQSPQAFGDLPALGTPEPASASSTNKRRGRPRKVRAEQDPLGQTVQAAVPKQGRGRPRKDVKGKERAYKNSITGDDGDSADQVQRSNPRVHRRGAGRLAKEKHSASLKHSSTSVSEVSGTPRCETLDPENCDSDFDSDVDIFKLAGNYVDDPDNEDEEPKSSFMLAPPGYRKEIKRRRELGIELEEVVEEHPHEEPDLELRGFGLLNRPPRRGPVLLRKDTTEPEECVTLPYQRLSSPSPTPPYVSLPPTQPVSSQPTVHDPYSDITARLRTSREVEKVLGSLLKGVALTSKTRDQTSSPEPRPSSFGLKPVMGADDTLSPSMASAVSDLSLEESLPQEPHSTILTDLPSSKRIFPLRPTTLSPDTPTLEHSPSTSRSGLHEEPDSSPVSPVLEPVSSSSSTNSTRATMPSAISSSIIVS